MGVGSHFLKPLEHHKKGVGREEYKLQVIEFLLWKFLALCRLAHRVGLHWLPRHSTGKACKLSTIEPRLMVWNIRYGTSVCKKRCSHNKGFWVGLLVELAAPVTGLEAEASCGSLSL